MSLNESGPAATAIANRASSINPRKDQKMNEHGYSIDAAPAPVLSRRRLITAVAAAGSAATLPAVALAEASSKTGRLPPYPEGQENSYDKAHRLAAELSQALAELDGCRWFATVYPDGHEPSFSYIFRSIRAYECARTRVSPELEQLIEAHRKAEAKFGNTCGAVDEVAIGGKPSKAAMRRWRQALHAEDKAFEAFLSFVPKNDASRAAKAEYLRWFTGRLYLNDRQMELLLDSMCGRTMA